MPTVGLTAHSPGVPKNEALMLGWLANAAMAGDEKAQELLEVAAEHENAEFDEN